MFLTCKGFNVGFKTVYLLNDPFPKGGSAGR